MTGIDILPHCKSDSTFPDLAERDGALAPVTATTQKFRQRPSWPRDKRSNT